MRNCSEFLTVDTGYEYIVPQDFRCCGVYSDQLYRLSSILMEYTANRQDRRDGEMFPFGSEQYRMHFGGEGSKVVGWAEEIGLVKRSGYITGKRSKLIVLTDRYRDGRFRVVAIGRKPRSSGRPPRSNETLGEIGQWLFGHLGKFKLPESPRCGNGNAWDAYLAYSFMTGRLRASRDTFGRFHSSLTGMSRVLRSQLTLTHVGGRCPFNVQHIEREGSAYLSNFGLSSSDQRALFELDVKTCQPLLVGAAAFNETLRPAQDLYDWLDMCQRADLYEYMRLETGGVLTRDEIKKETMVATFGTVKQALNKKVGKLIKRRFPSIWSFIEKLKEGDHRKAARYTQGQEARLMIDGAAASLMRSHPDVSIATVHDSITCPQFHIEPVRKAILEAFRLHGVVPQVVPTLLAGIAE